MSHAVRPIAGITLLVLSVGVGLLAVLGVAFIHHAVAGQFAAALLFAALVSLLELSYER